MNHKFRIQQLESCLRIITTVKDKFVHGLAIGFGVLIALTTAILAGAFVLYLALYTQHLNFVIEFLDRL